MYSNQCLDRPGKSNFYVSHPFSKVKNAFYYLLLMSRTGILSRSRWSSLWLERSRALKATSSGLRGSSSSGGLTVDCISSYEGRVESLEAIWLLRTISWWFLETAFCCPSVDWLSTLGASDILEWPAVTSSLPLAASAEDVEASWPCPIASLLLILASLGMFTFSVGRILPLDEERSSLLFLEGESSSLLLEQCSSFLALNASCRSSRGSASPSVCNLN